MMMNNTLTYDTKNDSHDRRRMSHARVSSQMTIKTHGRNTMGTSNMMSLDTGMWNPKSSQQNLCWVDLPVPHSNDGYKNRKKSVKLAKSGVMRNIKVSMATNHPDYEHSISLNK